jgi:hypothetical protein
MGALDIPVNEVRMGGGACARGEQQSPCVRNYITAALTGAVVPLRADCAPRVAEEGVPASRAVSQRRRGVDGAVRPGSARVAAVQERRRPRVGRAAGAVASTRPREVPSRTSECRGRCSASGAIHACGARVCRRGMGKARVRREQCLHWFQRSYPGSQASAKACTHHRTPRPSR